MFWNPGIKKFLNKSVEINANFNSEIILNIIMDNSKEYKIVYYYNIDNIVKVLSSQ